MTDTNGQEGLGSLLERVRAATGPDRELDGELFDRYGEGYLIWDGPEPLFVAAPPSEVRQTRYEVPAYTASVDAALALVARLLPTANCIGIELERGLWCGYVSRNGVKEGHFYKGAYAATAPALALVSALLSALQVTP